MLSGATWNSTVQIQVNDVGLICGSSPLAKGPHWIWALDCGPWMDQHVAEELVTSGTETTDNMCEWCLVCGPFRLKCGRAACRVLFINYLATLYAYCYVFSHEIFLTRDLWVLLEHRVLELYPGLSLGVDCTVDSFKHLLKIVTLVCTVLTI